MRTLVAVLVITLAVSGCAFPEDEEPDDPLLGICPQWVQGPWTGEAGVIDAPGEVVFSPDQDGEPLLELDGAPLDRYLLTLHNFTAAGELQLRVFADGKRLGIHDFRDPEGTQLVPVLTLGPGSDVEGKEFQVLLASIEHGSEPNPSAIEVRLSGDGAVGITATAHYRVCGAIVT